MIGYESKSYCKLLIKVKGISGYSLDIFAHIQLWMYGLTSLLGIHHIVNVFHGFTVFFGFRDLLVLFLGVGKWKSQFHPNFMTIFHHEIFRMASFGSLEVKEHVSNRVYTNFQVDLWKSKDLTALQVDLSLANFRQLGTD